jgi:hypothetical protein
MSESFGWGIRCVLCKRFEAAFWDLEGHGNNLYLLSKCSEHQGKSLTAKVLETRRVLTGQPPKRKWWKL